eukprot:COSAG06_NODE_39745_length_409_cov_0.841935_1_plen_52_part_10
MTCCDLQHIDDELYEKKVKFMRNASEEELEMLDECVCYDTTERFSGTIEPFE